MALPKFDKDKKKKAQTYRKVVLALVLFALALYGGIFYTVNKKIGSIAALFGSQEQTAAPIKPAPTGTPHPALKSNAWIPYYFHEKLIYCDSNYRMHVKTTLDSADVVSADLFSDGLARITLKNGEKTEYVYIDESGKIAIPADESRSYSGPFSEGVACAVDKETDKLGFIDKKGKYVIQPEFALSAFASGGDTHRADQLENAIFSSGLAPVYTSKLNETANLTPSCGYINHKGDFVIPVKFLAGGAFVDERARVSVKDESKWHHRWGYIDPKGKIVLKPIYMQVHDFSEGLAAVVDYKGKWGFIDRSGNFKIPAELADATSFSEGFAAAANAVASKKLWGYIKKDGSWLVQPRFQKALPFQDGEAYACNGCDGDRKPEEEFWINKEGSIERHTRRIVPLELLDLTKDESTDPAKEQ